MTTTQYLAALSKLDLPPHGIRTAALLGVSVRQLGRYANGHAIPAYVALLLAQYLKHGLPKEIRK